MLYIKSPYVKIIHNTKQKNLYVNSLTHRFVLLKPVQLEVLGKCIKATGLDELLKTYGEDIIFDMIRKYILVEDELFWKYNFLTHIEIETSTVCNGKCEYCPASYNPRRVEYMDIKLFDEILLKARNYGHIRFITLHSYNEPTIDDRFYIFAEKIEESKLKLILYSNGSGIDDKMLNYFKAYPSLRNIVINIPSIDKKTFEKMTNASYYDKTIYAIENLSRMDINISLSVQGYDNNHIVEETKKIQDRFPNIKIVYHKSFDRTGALKNHYAEHINNTNNFLHGCRNVMESLCVDVHGDLFLCCNDYERKVKYANIQDGNLKNILEKPAACDIRKKVWGGIEPEANFPCRHCVLISNTQY